MIQTCELETRLENPLELTVHTCICLQVMVIRILVAARVALCRGALVRGVCPVHASQVSVGSAAAIANTNILALYHTTVSSTAAYCSALLSFSPNPPSPHLSNPQGVRSDDKGSREGSHGFIFICHRV